MLCGMASTTTQSSPRAAASEAAARNGGGVPAPGSRLAEAFEGVERFPLLSEPRERVIAAATAETARVGDLIETVEADVALSISVLRFANRGGMTAGGVAGIPAPGDVRTPSG